VQQLYVGVCVCVCVSMHACRCTVRALCMHLYMAEFDLGRAEAIV
jgi:hypothetical protein